MMEFVWCVFSKVKFWIIQDTPFIIPFPLCLQLFCNSINPRKKDNAVCHTKEPITSWHIKRPMTHHGVSFIILELLASSDLSALTPRRLGTDELPEGGSTVLDGAADLGRLDAGDLAGNGGFVPFDDMFECIVNYCGALSRSDGG
jgi:hypothetical protein